MTRERRGSRLASDAPAETGRLGALLPLALAMALCVGSFGGAHAGADLNSPAVSDAASQRASVRWKELVSEANATRIRLETSAPTKYRVVPSAQPSPTVQVELLNAEVGNLPARVQVADGTIDTVETSSLSDGVGRIVLRLVGPGEASVVPWAGGIDLLVSLSTADKPAAAAEAKGRAIAQRLVNPERLAFVFGGTPANLSSFILSDGKRLVIDADGVSMPVVQSLDEFSEGPVARVRTAKQDGRVRAVVEAREGGLLDGHRLEKTADGFQVLFVGKAFQAVAAQASEEVRPKSAPAESTANRPAEAQNAPEPPPPGGGAVIDLGFRHESTKSFIEVALSKPAPHVVREAAGQRIVVDILRTSLPSQFRRALDTSGFPSAVRLIAAYSRTGKGKTTDTRLVVDLRSPAPYRIERQGPRITIVVEGGAPEQPVQGVADLRRDDKEVVVVEGKPGASSAKAGAEPAKVEAPQRQTASGYTGRRLSMDFMDADIRNVLRLIGEVSGLNLVAGDDVQGKVTIRLVDVPWDQALEVILKTKSLDQVRDGNVVRIAPAEKLAAEKARLRDAEKGVEEKAPLVSEIISVNYATASELVDKIKASLTPRGSVAVDQRTNALLIKDVAEKIKESRVLVARLDTPTPQVLIEARIVEVNSNYSRDLGIQWGGKYTADAVHGNATNWAFPNSIGVEGSTGTGPNFAVNFPAAVGVGGAGGALSLNLGHINDILSLNLRISALESAGQGRVISSPRVATLDNRTAEISQGSKIPFTNATQEKVETKEIEYLLKLNVTPHVTADKSIIMKINLTKDAADFSIVASDGSTPSKATKAASTEVIVKDGETTVIGGIITDEQTESRTGLPFFSKLPWIGWMFRETLKKTDRKELVIFITPKILHLSPMSGSL